MDINKISSNPRAFQLLIFIVIILVISVGYYYYKNLQKRFANELYFIKGAKNAKDGAIFSGKRRLKSIIGNEFSYSFWIKIDDWDHNFNKPKHVFHVGDKDGDNVCPGVWLYPKNNNLLVRVNTHDRLNNISKTESGKECQNWASQTPHKHEYKPETHANDGIGDHEYCRDPNNQYRGKGSWCFTRDPKTRWERCSYNSYTDAPSMNPLKNPDVLGEDKQCDLVNIPVQRWNHVAIVLINRTVDVYLNGKLARSCTLNNVPIMNEGDLYVNQEGGFNGELSDLLYSNRALSTKDIYSIYRAGYRSNTILDQLRKIIPNENKVTECSSGKTTTKPNLTANDILSVEPNTPGCYVKLPSGCPNHPRQAEITNPLGGWSRDTWGEDNKQSHTSKEKCDQRAADFNKWCGVDDAETLQVQNFEIAKPGKYMLGDENSLKCPAGYETVPEDKCEKVGRSLLPSNKKMGRTLQVGEFDFVPAGCSLQTKGDWTAFYAKGLGATEKSLDKEGGYIKVCQKEPGQAYTPATSCMNGRNFDCKHEGQFCSSSASQRKNSYCCINNTWTPSSEGECKAHRDSQTYM